MSALKKLKNKSRPLKNGASLQLMALKKMSASGNNSNVGLLLRNELRKVSNQTLVSIVVELIAPFNPLLSWFNEGSSFRVSTNMNGHKSHTVIGRASLLSLEKNRIAYTPLKSPPCKKCPAVNGDMCRCAMKKFAIQ